MTEIRELLDQLDQAHAAATRGAWRARPDDHAVDVTTHDGFFVALDAKPADAAAIVAEHNAIPQLVAAVRGVLDRHRPVSQNVYAATPLRDPVDVCAIDTTTTWPCPTVKALTAALSPAEVTR